MSLEQNLAELNTNLKALIAALAAGGAATSASTGATGETKAATGKGKTKDTAPKVSREEMVAALTEVKEKFSAADAKEIIESSGAKKMAEIPDGKIASVFAAAKAKLAEEDDTGTDTDDGL